MTPPREEVPTELADLIRAAGTPTPPPGLEESMLQSLRSAMPAMAASAGATAAAGKVASAALGKWGVATTVAALIVGSVGGIVVGRTTAPEVQVAANQKQLELGPVADPPTPAPAPEQPQPTPVPQPPPRRVEKPPAPRDSLVDEQQLIEMARTALLRREPALAMTPLAEHERRFPSGQLSEERDAMWIQALVLAAQREPAATRATEFRRKYPNSLLLPVVERALEPLP